jgi:DNA-binding HxlR family transcriptional regulator
MKRYAQVCPLARALDVIGDRWNLLIVRELLVGPRRYTDLMDGLPGIGTNVLAARLRDLHASGLVAKRALPPPTAVTVYELTEPGRALGPSLAALRRWGADHAPAVRANDAVRPAWVLMSAVSDPAADVEPGLVCELRVDSEVFQLRSEPDGLSLHGGASARADATLELDTATLGKVAVGRLTARSVGRQCLVEGSSDIATQFLSALSNTVGH